MMLTDLLALNKVIVLTGVNIREITDEGLAATINGEEKLIKADTFVIATGLKPDDGLYQALKGQFSTVYMVGDCREPRNIMGAVWDGFEAGRSL
jgi:2-enoate reductase